MLVSDKEGEVLAYGTTVPYPTVETPTDQLKSNAHYLVEKLVADHDAFCASSEGQEGNPSIAIPVPVAATDEDNVHDLHVAAMRAVSVVTEALALNDYCVISLTPVVMSPDGTEKNIMTGYLLLACQEKSADKFSATKADIANAWTERCHTIYGRAAIENLQEQMTRRMQESFADTEDDGENDKPNDTVH